MDEVDTIKEKEEKRDISMLMESVIGERPLEEKVDTATTTYCQTSLLAHMYVRSLFCLL